MKTLIVRLVLFAYAFVWACSLGAQICDPQKFLLSKTPIELVACGELQCIVFEGDDDSHRYMGVVSKNGVLLAIVRVFKDGRKEEVLWTVPTITIEKEEPKKEACTENCA